MKKSLFALLALLTVLSMVLTGCGATATPVPPTVLLPIVVVLSGAYITESMP